MPYKSDRQRRYFNANRDKLESEGVDVDHWNEESKGKDLPEKASFEIGKAAAAALRARANDPFGGAVENLWDKRSAFGAPAGGATFSPPVAAKPAPSFSQTTQPGAVQAPASPAPATAPAPQNSIPALANDAAHPDGGGGGIKVAFELGKQARFGAAMRGLGRWAGNSALGRTRTGKVGLGAGGLALAGFGAHQAGKQLAPDPLDFPDKPPPKPRWWHPPWLGGPKGETYAQRKKKDLYGTPEGLGHVVNRQADEITRLEGNQKTFNSWEDLAKEYVDRPPLTDEELGIGGPDAGNEFPGAQPYKAGLLGIDWSQPGLTGHFTRGQEALGAGGLLAAYLLYRKMQEDKERQRAPAYPMPMMPQGGGGRNALFF